jgi:hypothetical protein
MICKGTPARELEQSYNYERSSGTVQEAVPLFDAYRQFYEQPADPEGAQNFSNREVM